MASVDFSAVPTAPLPGLPYPGDRPRTIALAQRLHDTVVQRLAGLSLMLGAEQSLADPDTRSVCRAEISAALDELRSGLELMLDDGDATARGDVVAELAAFRDTHPKTVMDLAAADALSGHPLVDAFLVEGLRNARKHSEPSRVVVELEQSDGAITLTLRNDGVRHRPVSGCGIGLRLLETECAMYGALVLAGPGRGPGSWSLRLVLPDESGA